MSAICWKMMSTYSGFSNSMLSLAEAFHQRQVERAHWSGDSQRASTGAKGWRHKVRPGQQSPGSLLRAWIRTHRIGAHAPRGEMCLALTIARTVSIVSFAIHFNCRSLTKWGMWNMPTNRLQLRNSPTLKLRMLQRFLKGETPPGEPWNNRSFSGWLCRCPAVLVQVWASLMKAYKNHP